MAKLRVHNIESGPASSDVAFGISGDTIAVSSDSLKLNTWKDSGGNTLFVSDGAGTLSSVNSGISGGGPKLILSQTADGDSSISFTSGIDSTYDKYMIVCTPIAAATDQVHFQFQCSTDGGSNYNTTMTTTTWHAQHNEADWDSGIGYNTSIDQAQGTAYQDLLTYLGNAAKECGAGILQLYSPSSTTYLKQFMWNGNNYMSYPSGAGEAYTWEHFVAGYFNTTSAINAISFKVSSGNFSGKVKLYGVS